MNQVARSLLTINAGSSSVRLALYEYRDDRLELVARARHDGVDEADAALLREFLGASATDVGRVVHRVVYGGSRLGEACVIDEQVERDIERLKPIAPLHNPLALRWVRACRKVFGGDVTQVAVFDTAFFAALPEVASTYALPRTLCREFGLRRHGFHGIAHSVMLRQWRTARPDLSAAGKVITIQLGSGCSITAVDGGQARDTSMGFSPLEGLVMATRSGDLDPGLITYLQRHAGKTLEDIDHLLNEESGLKGISEQSGDMRVLLESEDAAARLAVDIYCYRVRKYTGAYLAVLGGADGVVFGGGVGENSPAVRRKILEGMDWLGISLDQDLNERAVGMDAAISASGSRIEVRVVCVDESAEMARVGSALTGTSNSEGKTGGDDSG
ncbi:acetate kinase [bacterium BMS3Abin01]|nr:acetate kinase [bacterium BMS3Abin01]